MLAVDAPAVMDGSSRLRLVLRQPDGTITPIEPGVSTDLEVDFIAFAAHGRFSGRIKLDAARLTDMLNEHDEFELARVRAELLNTGKWRIVPRVVLRRDELILVHAGGPRGDVVRRQRTLPRTITVKAGRYTVTGEVHTLPGLDPLVQFRRRRQPMVPLTDAVISYEGLRGQVDETVETVVVNRDRVDWIRRTGVLA